MDFAKLYEKAHQAGLAAGNAAQPVPMVVGTPTTLFGHDIDYTKKTYYVSDGVCGFAWVAVRPRNAPFAKWLVANDKGRSSEYDRAILVWVREFGQSLERKCQYAAAFAAVIAEAGIRCHADSRID